MSGDDTRGPTFTRVHEVLAADGVSLAEVAARVGTPAYVYSGAAVLAALERLRAGVRPLAHRICYALKANASFALLELLAQNGADFDAGSFGELARVLVAGVGPERVILSGVGKSDREIQAALSAGILYFGVESRAELEAIARHAAARRARAPVVLRVNPDIDARTHPHITTGLAESKFGIPHDEAFELADWVQEQPALELAGVSCHIGSQITTLEPFRDAARRLAGIAGALVRDGAPLRYVGLGGGLGITYSGERPPTPHEYGVMLKEELGSLGLAVVLEPGRLLVGNAGVLLTRVVRVKRGGERDLVIVDAGMNDLLRPALYGAHHEVEPVGPAAAESAPVDVVGPVCESSDRFARARVLPRLAEGDLVVLHSAGAYAFAMSSNYNGRPRAAEVLIHDGQVHVARERERVVDLWRGERRLDGSAVPAVLPPSLMSFAAE